MSASGRLILVILEFLNKHKTRSAEAVTMNLTTVKGTTPYDRRTAIIGLASTTFPFSIRNNVKYASMQLNDMMAATRKRSRAL